MIKSIRNYKQIVLAILLILSVFCVDAKLNNEVAFYIENYGELTAQQDPRVEQAQAVFKRVRSVADRNSKRLAKLVIINNNTHPWAIALPAGHIILSRQVLDIVHRHANTELAEARLAFVLGHELAHLANDDFWHHEVESFMQDTEDAQKISKFISQHFEAKQAELAADDKGYLYAAMAGYPVDLLLQNSTNQQSGRVGKEPVQDFFTFWMQQTNTKISPSHPAAKDRAELLRQRLNQLKKKLVFFNFGSRLAHFGRCNDAIYFLKEFQKVFPGRSVLNNLGLCFLQQARAQMPEQQLAFYWLPLSLDTRSRAAGLKNHGKVRVRASTTNLEAPKQFLKNYSANNDNISEYLEDAVHVLALAIEKDPWYLPARINLAITYLYQGKPHQARATLAEAKQQSDSNIQIEMLDALALYEQTDSDLDLWATALKKMERLQQKGNSSLVLYNHARLLSARPRTAQAQIDWNSLRTEVDSLPAEIRKEICTRQKVDSLDSCLQRNKKRVTRPNWNWLFKVDNQALTSSDRKKIKTAWHSVPFDWVSADLHGFIHQRKDEDIEMLEMNQSVQMQVLKGNPVAELNQINSYCEYPFIKRKLDVHEVWTCDNWAVLVVNQQAKEIWYLQN